MSQAITIEKTNASTNRERFVRIAEARTSRAIKAVRLIRNLSNTYLYEYEQTEIQTILTALQEEVDALKLAFAQKNKKNSVFLLPSTKSKDMN